jgi:D-alanyl-D-alanine carboxypeptidase (penicillin-binding protein 5/6)
MQFHQKLTDVVFISIPAALGLLFLIFIFLDVCLLQTLQDLKIHQNPFPNFHIHTYPLLTAQIVPDISAQSAIIMDATSHVFVYQKNTYLRLSPASTTKMMTALVGLSYFHPHDTLTVKEIIDSENSGLNFSLDEQLTFDAVLKAALMYSANDAASVIAQNYPGGEKTFVAAMNAKAQMFHLWNTHFGDPDGLDDTQDYTTAQDLIRLAAIAMQNPLFASIVATRTTTISSVDGKNSYPITNRNILLGYDGINGIKTGYTDEAGEVLATSVINNGHTYYMIVMKSQDRFTDTKRLLTLLPTIKYLSFTEAN